jgi:proline iminopeptidase
MNSFYLKVTGVLQSMSLALACACLVNTLFAAPATLNGGELAPGEYDVTLGDVRLHYTVAGHGPLLIVCSPGWGINSGYLQGGLVPLEKNHTLLFIDTRGSGLSTRPADRSRMSSADMADDIEHLRKYLGLGAIRLLGHSDSGDIVIDYAERYPAMLDELIVVDGVTLGDGKANREEDARQQQIMKDLSHDPRNASAMRALNAPDFTTDEAMNRSLLDGLPVYFADPQKNIPVLLKTEKTSASPSSWAAQAHDEANKAHAWHQEDLLGRIHTKTLIIVGKQDWICPVIISEHVHAGIRGSKLLEVDESGHFPWIEQPAIFFATVNRFLSD